MKTAEELKNIAAIERNEKPNSCVLVERISRALYTYAFHGYGGAQLHFNEDVIVPIEVFINAGFIINKEYKSHTVFLTFIWDDTAPCYPEPYYFVN